MDVIRPALDLPDLPPSAIRALWSLKLVPREQRLPLSGRSLSFASVRRLRHICDCDPALPATLRAPLPKVSAADPPPDRPPHHASR